MHYKDMYLEINIFILYYIGFIDLNEVVLKGDYICGS